MVLPEALSQNLLTLFWGLGFFCLWGFFFVVIVSFLIGNGKIEISTKAKTTTSVGPAFAHLGRQPTARSGQTPRARRSPAAQGGATSTDGLCTPDPLRCFQRLTSLDHTLPSSTLPAAVRPATAIKTDIKEQYRIMDKARVHPSCPGPAYSTIFSENVVQTT